MEEEERDTDGDKGSLAHLCAFNDLVEPLLYEYVAGLQTGHSFPGLARPTQPEVTRSFT
jgi:hypothetical protein